MKEIVFDVAFTPNQVKGNSATICVVIDVIRASTTITNLLIKECKEVLLTTDEQEFIKKNSNPLEYGTMICAEQVSGYASQDAHFSPSVKEVKDVLVKNKRIVMRTTNGTVAVHKVGEKGIRHIFIGCMNNARAVMEQAVLLAMELNTGITIVSAGREKGQIPCLDDAYCAAKLLMYGKDIAKKHRIKPVVEDSGSIACSLLLGYKDTEEAFYQSASGKVMGRIGCEEDIELCAQENTTDVVGKVIFNNDKIMIKRYQSA